MNNWNYKSVFLCLSKQANKQTNLPGGPEISFLILYPKEWNLGGILKRYLDTHFYCSIMHNSQEVEATPFSTE